ncbi:MAG: NAD(P)-dependent oxidoreductase, partial [Nanoarchaeota archaeon]
MKWDVLISAPYMQKELDDYIEFFENNDINIDVPEVNERLEENELLEIIDKYHGVVSGDDEFTERVFKKADDLKVISKWGTGIDSIDLEAAKKYDVEVYNTPDAFSHPVADTVFGFILTFLRNIIEMDKEMKEGKWNKIKGKSLSEVTLGIIGVGNVGSQVARRANSFNMKILGSDIRKIKSILIEEYDINMVSKEELYKKSDIISLNCDLNETSYHLLTKTEFSKMG